MGKKKGGAKNKLARMSEEERARYLQQRADMEEEARRRKQQLICLYMKNKLKREEAFSRLNLAKINQEWRFILRKIKCKELQNEIIEVEKFFRSSLEQKNRIIRRLLCDLDEAEDLYSTLKQSHMENIERLMSIQGERLNYFREKFIKEKNSMLIDWNEEFEKYKAGRDNSQKEMECIFYGLEKIFKQDELEHEDDHRKKVDDIKSEMTIKLENIIQSRENELESLWKEYQQIINDYHNYTETFYAEYIDLRERDDINTKLIQQHCYDVAKATDQIAELKFTLETNTEQYDFQIDYLQKMRNNLNHEFLQMKLELEKKLHYNKEKFKYVTVNSHSVNKFLMKILQKGKIILQIAETCEKLETEYEKILPFHFTSNELYKRNLADSKTPPDEFKEIALETLMNFENFWLRINRTKTDIIILKEEKQKLEYENLQLKNQLKNYLINITIDCGSSENAENRLQQINRPHSMKIEKIQHINLDELQQQYYQDRKYFNTNYSYLSKSADRKGARCLNDTINKRQRPITSVIEGNFCNAIRSVVLNKGKINTAPQLRAIKISNL